MKPDLVIWGCRFRDNVMPSSCTVQSYICKRARSEPFPELDGVQAAFAVKDGMRLKVPDDCPHDIGEVTRQCWSTVPDDRPEFEDILKIVQKSEDEVNGEIIYVTK